MHYSFAEKTHSSAAASAAREVPFAHCRLDSDRTPDGGSGAESTWYLGDLINDLKQASKLIGRGIRTDVNRITDARRFPSVGVEPACRGHADSFHQDA